MTAPHNNSTGLGDNNRDKRAAAQPTAPSMLIAFRVLQRHGDCLADDVSLNDLIEDIAQQIDAAKATEPPHG